MSYAQNVTTWHNDNNRTGWQSNETILTPSNVSQPNNFGLLWQWPVTGFVFAQPLAVASVQTNNTICQPCDLVFVATEQDMLYAFKASSPSSTPVWSLNLAQAVNGSPVQCGTLPSNLDFEPCGTGLLGPYVGVTGTPVIDMGTSPHPTLYVAAAVYFGGPPAYIAFYLFAVDITTGSMVGNTAIAGMVNGHSPGLAGQCKSDYPTGGTVTFDPDNHIQRSALLLLNSKVYVAFAPGGGNELGNGWMFGYSFTNSTSSFAPTAVFNSTPYGTGGGIWQAGAGPASDGTSIYVATANGTLFDPVAQVYDRGDSLLRLDPSSLAVLDYYAPPDVLTYPSTNKGVGYCINDFDFGSGGVLVFPDAFYHDLNTGTYPNLLVNADKESNLSVTNRANLGKYNPSGGNNIQTVLTLVAAFHACRWIQTRATGPAPLIGNMSAAARRTTCSIMRQRRKTRLLAPYPINAYQLLPSGFSGPILQAPTASTPTLFCLRSPTPSVSSNSTSATTGIVWAIEHGNTDNPGTPPDCNGSAVQAALHAFNASNLAAPELYNSRGLAHHTTGSFTAFSTPTIFNGYVYMGTQTEVNVFGLCSQQFGCPLQ